MSAWRPGDLNERIDLKSKVYTPDGIGGGAMELTTFASVWAAVRPQSGGEREEADRVEGATRYKFALRYRAELTGVVVIGWRGVDHNVTAVLDRGPHSMYIEIEAVRGVAP